MCQTRTPVPALTSEQRNAALWKAMGNRAERSKMLKAVKAGQVTVREFLQSADEGNEVAQRTRAWSLIKAVPGIGFAKAQKVMKEARISESRRIAGLGIHQRERLIELCEGGAR